MTLLAFWLSSLGLTFLMTFPTSFGIFRCNLEVRLQFQSQMKWAPFQMYPFSHGALGDGETRQVIQPAPANPRSRGVVAPCLTYTIFRRIL